MNTLSIDGITVPTAFTPTDSNAEPLYYFKSSRNGMKYGPCEFDKANPEFQALLKQQGERSRAINSSLSTELKNRNLPFTTLKNLLAPCIEQSVGGSISCSVLH